MIIQQPDRLPTVDAGALILTRNSTDTRWFHDLSAHATAICFPTGRLKETTTLQGPALFYFGAHVDAFTRLCSPFGVVLHQFAKGEKGGA